MKRTVYRIENPLHHHGMWYDKRGRFDPIIQRLCPNGIAKDFPMPLNIDLHRKDGLIWNSAGKSIENMNQWFSPEDALRLCNSGFRLYKFEVILYQELPKEILFCRGGIIAQEEIPLEIVWDINNERRAK